MKQEYFNEMLGLNEAIKHLEQVKEMVDRAHMEMCLPGPGTSDPGEIHRDEVNAAYYGFIPMKERDKLTAEMRERLKAVIAQRIDELKAEFEKI